MLRGRATRYRKGVSMAADRLTSYVVKRYGELRGRGSTPAISRIAYSRKAMAGSMRVARVAGTQHGAEIFNEQARPITWFGCGRCRTKRTGS